MKERKMQTLEEKINEIMSVMDAMKSFPTIEKIELEKWNDVDIERLLITARTIKEKLYDMSKLCITGNCNALENLGEKNIVIDIFKMLAENI